ncbi:MAG TPA: DHA2 family efflux MFS transporter permease subunit [Nocardia sp.]|uniref:DHA2 family efflux MFS transporter permease subunit n=1 Tax=Nocardia sp. TaxID=1821 RepID=UPI002B4B5182|nr:DHA2 family efflux MFS transporter permease subunit [Nocardia sp.]HLS75991.1 DHA2 family efflux MFS transporter permease subunit [Nocardia sp.]
MATGAETGTQRSPGAIWTLVVVALATFMLMLDLTVVNVALPDIRAAFDSSFSALQWILDAYALGLAAVLLAAGSLADRLGRKRVFDVGLIVFVLSSLACGLAPSDTVLIIARFVQGLGGAILFAVGPALLGNEFRGKDRGMAFGVFGAVTGLAIAFGPLIGGGLAETAGWRWIFLINVPVTIAAIAIGYLKMRESRADTPPPVDWPGMVTFSAALFFLVLGFMRGEADGWTSWIVLGCFGLAVVLLAAFTWLQVSRPEQAMFDLSLFANRTFNGLSVVTALCALTVMPSLFLLIAYVQNMLGYSAFASGVRFLPLTLLLFVAAAGAGALVAKVHPGVLVGVSQLLIGAGLAAVVLVDVESSWTALVPAMVLIGLGMGVFNPPRAAFSIAVTTPDKAGMASGINETFQQAGVAVGIAAVGAFFHNRVSGAFAETDTARNVFRDQAETAGDAVAAGGPGAVLDGLPALATGVVREAAETAFVDGLHTTMLLVAALAVVSGIVAFCTMRPGDLDEAALDSPGVPADGAAAPAERPAARPSELAAQRAAEIIAQVKAEAGHDATSGHEATSGHDGDRKTDVLDKKTLEKAAGQGRTDVLPKPARATRADADPRTAATERSGVRKHSAPSRAAVAAGGRRRVSSSTQPANDDNATSRTTPGTRSGADAARRGGAGRRAATDRDRTSTPDRNPTAGDTIELDKSTLGSTPLASSTRPATDTAAPVDTVLRSPVSGRFTDGGTRRSARRGEGTAKTERTAAGRHHLTAPKPIAPATATPTPRGSTGTDDAVTDALPADTPPTDTPPTDTPASDVAATTGNTTTATATTEPREPATTAADPAPATTESATETTESATETTDSPAIAARSSAAATSAAASASEPKAANGRRAAGKRTTGTGGKHRAPGEEAAPATPRHARGRRAASGARAATAVKSSAARTADTATEGSTAAGARSTSAEADAETASATPAAKPAENAAAKPAETAAAKPAENAAESPSAGTAAAQAADRPQPRKRTRGAAKAAAAQPPAKTAAEPAKAAGRPAKAAKQPAKRAANGTARKTAAKKAAPPAEKTTD